MTYYVGNMPCGEDELTHWGVKGMKWGQRRYQNRDGSLTAAGRVRYGWGKVKSGANRAYGRAVSSSKKYWGSPKKRKEMRRKVGRALAVAGSTAAVGALGYAAYKRGFRGFNKMAKSAGTMTRSFNIPNRPRLTTGAKTFDAGRLRYTTRARNAARSGIDSVKNRVNVMNINRTRRKGMKTGLVVGGPVKAGRKSRISTIGEKTQNMFRKKSTPYGNIHPGQARISGGSTFDGSKLKRSTVIKNRVNEVRGNVKSRMNTASINRARRKGMKTGLVVGGPVKAGKKARRTSAGFGRAKDTAGYVKAQAQEAGRRLKNSRHIRNAKSSSGRVAGKTSTIRGSRSFKRAQAGDRVRNAIGGAGSRVANHVRRNAAGYGFAVGAGLHAGAAYGLGREARKRGRSKKNARVAGASYIIGGGPGYAAYRVGDRVVNGNWGGYTRKKKSSKKKARK